MQRPTTKGELLAIIQLDYDALLAQVNRNSPAQQATLGVNGEWAIKDVVTHLMAWEQLLLGWYRAGQRGEPVITPAPGHTWGWKSLGALNQRIFEEHRHLAPTDALRAFAVSHGEVLALIETLSEEELFTPARYEWLGKATLEASIRANTYNHYRWATKQIHQWNQPATGRKRSCQNHKDSRSPWSAVAALPSATGRAFRIQIFVGRSTHCFDNLLRRCQSAVREILGVIDGTFIFIAQLWFGLRPVGRQWW